MLLIPSSCTTNLCSIGCDGEREERGVCVCGKETALREAVPLSDTQECGACLQSYVQTACKQERESYHITLFTSSRSWSNVVLFTLFVFS